MGLGDRCRGLWADGEQRGGGETARVCVCVCVGRNALLSHLYHISFVLITILAEGRNRVGALTYAHNLLSGHIRVWLPLVVMYPSYVSGSVLSSNIQSMAQTCRMFFLNIIFIKKASHFFVLILNLHCPSFLLQEARRNSGPDAGPPIRSHPALVQGTEVSVSCRHAALAELFSFLHCFFHAACRKRKNKLMDSLFNVIRGIIDMLPGRCKTINSSLGVCVCLLLSGTFPPVQFFPYNISLSYPPTHTHGMFHNEPMVQPGV